MSGEAGRSRSKILTLVGAAALVVAAGAGGWLLRGAADTPSPPGQSGSASVRSPAQPAGLSEDCGALPAVGNYRRPGDAPTLPADVSVQELMAELASEDVGTRWDAASQLGLVGPEAEQARAALTALREDEQPGVDERYPERTVGSAAREALVELDRWAGIVAYWPSFNSVRDVPWKKWSVPTAMGFSVGLGAITTFKDGEATSEEAAESSGYGMTLEQVLYGDLTGDGREEAVLVMEARSMRWSEYELHVYGLDGGRPHQLGRIGPCRESGYCALHDVAIDEGRIVIEQPWWKRGDPTCCASQVRHVEWVWSCGRLVMAGDATYFAASEGS